MSGIVEVNAVNVDVFCNTCKHHKKGTLSCKAFKRIPDAILNGGKHSKPVKGQVNDIIYEKDK